MSLTVVPFFRPASRPRDWNNQELAEFYRVEASMIRGGMSVVTDRGLSDEGDPWFVFCRADNEEVIVHFARIDGEYVVASPAFDECVRGNDFRPLIERLIDSHPMVVPKAKSSKNIFIHPAALLVALVTTCFFKLGQTDAVAAEIKGAKLAVATSGSSDHQEAARGTNPVFLNEQAANVVLAIIATASSWTTTGLFKDDASVQLPETSPAEVQTQTGSANLSDCWSSLLENASGVQTHSHALNVHDSNALAIFDPGEAVSPFFSLRVQLSNAGDFLIHKVLETEAVSTAAVFQTLTVPHPAQPSAQTGNPESVPTFTQPTMLSSALAQSNNGAASSADQEVLWVLGDTIQAHLFNGQLTVEQKLVLAASSTDTVSLSSQASVAEMSPAAVAPVAVHNVVAPSASAPATSSQTDKAADIDLAIHKFVAIHPDFLLFTVHNEVILFDSHLTVGNMSAAQHQEFSYTDGSTIFLIGLPAPASSDIGIMH